MKITHKISGCEDRSCPAVWETDDPAVLAVQGTRTTAAEVGAAGEIPAHEDIVLVPRDVLARISR